MTRTITKNLVEKKTSQKPTPKNVELVSETGEHSMHNQQKVSEETDWKVVCINFVAKQRLEFLATWKTLQLVALQIFR